MGYFAVLKPADAGESEAFDIKRCHINMWVLPSFIPGRRLLYFDLGLEVLSLGEKPVKAVEVLLPFTVEEGFKGDQFRCCEDLYDALLHDETAELIFGEPVAVSGPPQDRTLTLDSGDVLHPRHIDADRVTAAPDQPPRSSCYSVPLAVAVLPGRSAYVRFRFRVFANRPLLTGKSPFGGVILDFRIADVRESRTRSSEVDIRQRIMPIDKVNFFAMLPVQYQLLTASPTPRNMRVLETHAWGKYLEGVAYRDTSKPQLVYYWRSEADCQVSSDNPFRVFANYDRHLNKTLVVFWLILALLLIAAVVRSDWIPGISADTARSGLAHLVSVFGLLTAAGVIAAGRWLFNTAMNRFAKPRLLFRRAERWVLGKL
ncbi:Uncharacterised protein [Mycobacteroides abscessus subsp. bolletii]|uniref:hypothetical protein n=1 Tax=Mycobacteroides abscessus TaxID=36809 RepID=UPI0009A86943|nr:hypothetical protein [Mycobacteroides abscessus]SKK41147.1 Uncharacterised protein [Mycobacteroides abscessus subsp. bolletii]